MVPALELPVPPAHGNSLELTRVSKLYGSFVALRDLTLRFAAGSSVLVLGPNGAGKSTLLKLLAGLTQPSYGTVQVFGRSPTQSRGQIAYMGHHSMLYDDLTGPENLRYLLSLERPQLSRAEAGEHAAQALREVGLDPANPRRVGEYSQGMRQRTSLARVLLQDPDLLLLDEPFSNLDVASADAMVARLHRFLATPATGEAPRTLLLTTHQAELARSLARQTLVLREGGVLSAPASQPGPQPVPARVFPAAAQETAP